MDVHVITTQKYPISVPHISTTSTGLTTQYSLPARQDTPTMLPQWMFFRLLMESGGAPTSCTCRVPYINEKKNVD